MKLTRFFSVSCTASVLAAIPLLALAPDQALAQTQSPSGSAGRQQALSQDDKTFLSQSETFVADLSNVAIQQLVNPQVPREQRVTKFREILRTSFDINSIARFVLGRYWRVATPAQREEYLQLFEKLLIKLYEEKFQQYNGQTLTVVGSRLASGGKFALVASKIKDPAAPQPINVEWRVLRGESLKIADVVVEGISMGLSQRQEFAAVIQRNGGSVEALLNVMRQNATMPPAGTQPDTGATPPGKS